MASDFVSLPAGQMVMVYPAGDEQLRVARYDLDGDRQERRVPNTVRDMVQAVVELGADYGEVIELLIEAREAGVLGARLEFDALPEPGRSYERDSADADLLDDVPATDAPAPVDGDGAETGVAETDDAERLTEPSGESSDDVGSSSGSGAGSSDDSAVGSGRKRRRRATAAPIPEMFRLPSQREIQRANRDEDWDS